MSDNSPGEGRRIDRVAREFDRAWHEDRRPRMEDHLGGGADEVRLLFPELLRIELRHRIRRGESPTVSEYERRFPERAAEVRAAFEIDGPALGPREDSGATVSFRPEGAREADPDGTLSYVCLRPDGECGPSIAAQTFAAMVAAFPPGTMLQGRYVIETELGRGGMGLVYRGRDRRLGDRPVAIKVILPDAERGTLDEAAVRAAFEEEARLGANLVHPAIATVYDFGLHNEVPFTVFEYIPGETLGALLRRRGRLPLDEVRLVLGPLAQALDFAHARHIIHRDLKPENIRATEQGPFKVLDLGLARRFLQASDWSGFAGTPAYAAPEQAGGLPCDGRADQYALALIAYESLTGRRLFRGRDARQLLEMHRSQDPCPFLEELPEDVPTAVHRALRRAFEKDPSKRFTTCEEFALALGCRLIVREPAAPPHVLLETDIKKMSGAWVAERFAIHLSRSKPHRLVLTSDSILATSRGTVMRWPLANVESVRDPRGKALSLGIRSSDGLKEQTFVFASRDECGRWRDGITEAKSGALRSSEGFEGPRIDPVVLFRKRAPTARYLILGPVESRRGGHRGAEEDLKLRAVMLGADAVLDVQEERLPEFNGTVRRLTGVAVQAADQAGRRELKARWFLNQIDDVFRPLLVVEVLIITLLIAVPWAFLIQRGREWVILLHAYFAALIVGALGLKWPQLMRTTTIVGYVLLLHPIVVLSYFGAAWIKAVALLGSQVFLLNRSRRCYREYVNLLDEAQRTTPGARSLACKLVAALSIVVFIAPFLGTRLGQAPDHPFRIPPDSVASPRGGSTAAQGRAQPMQPFEMRVLNILKATSLKEHIAFMIPMWRSNLDGTVHLDVKPELETFIMAERRLTQLEALAHETWSEAIQADLDRLFEFGPGGRDEPAPDKGSKPPTKLADAVDEFARSIAIEWIASTTALLPASARPEAAAKSIDEGQALARREVQEIWRDCWKASIAPSVLLAEELVRVDPPNADYWNTLGLAQYTSENYRGAASSLERARSSRREGESEARDALGLAAVLWRLGDRDRARAEYSQGAESVGKNQPSATERSPGELGRLRAHVESLINDGG